jgi:hypothetical protein
MMMTFSTITYAPIEAMPSTELPFDQSRHSMERKLRVDAIAG